MSLIDMLLVGVGLSMDAFAVSVCKGLSAHKVNWAQAFITALSFGIFQAGMPIIGWLLGSSVIALIEPIDHWVAFVLLAIVGGKMIYDAIHDDGESCEVDSPNPKRFFAELLVLSIATSIDALVVGISFAMADISIWVAVAVIGMTTFVLSLIGFIVGNKFGSKFQKPATLAGGIALILLGVKIILEHLGIV